MSLDTVDIYYFSGTGNTLLVVRKMREVFMENGSECNLYPIEESKLEDVKLDHTIGIAFPVAVLSTYNFVWDFVKSLPEAQGTKIFMVDTLGGFSGGIVGPLRKIVENKGYIPIGAKEIVMPANVFYIQDEKTCKEKVEKGLLKAEEYTLNIINGKSKWGRVPVISDAVYYTSIAGLKLTETNLNQKWFYMGTENEKCKKCGICVKLCPVDNIEMKEGEYPKHLFHCEYCLRCTSLCPRGAIPCKLNYKGKTYRAVKAKDFLK
jgi:ferredoxin